jgi:hypothetical protein
MKFTIDTTAKTVEVDGTVNLKELTDLLKKFVGDEWKEYSIKDTTTTKWYYYPYSCQTVINPPYTVTFGTTGNHFHVIANP